MADEDLYGLLGVPRDADADAIKAAWRELARKLHPDRNQGDEAAVARFQRLSAAYAVLSDPDKRIVYDHLGLGAVRESTTTELARALREARDKKTDPASRDEQRREEARRRSERAARAASRHVQRDATGRRPSSAFTGSRPTESTVTVGPRRGDDVRVDLVIFLREAARGGVHEVEVARAALCDACGGSGWREVGRRCRECGGEGRRPTRAMVPIRVPVSVVTGTTLQLVGAGSPGSRGGDPGDLYVTVRVRPDPVFRRENLNLHVDVHLSPADAAAGGRHEVPTLGGTVLVDFPRNAVNGQKVRVIGMGMPGPPGRTNGDLYATVRIER